MEDDAIVVPITGTAEIPASAMAGGSGRGLDAVADLGLDPTGVKDCSDLLQGYLESDAAECGQLHFSPGTYYFAKTVETNQKNVMMVGDGHLANMGDAPVVFTTDQELESILWWNGARSNSNMNGPRLDHIQFQDRSPNHNKLRAAVRFTATANMEVKIGFQNLRPQRYTSGTVKVETNSTKVAGTNTQWAAKMAPGWMVVDGYPYEIRSVESAGALTLAIEYQGASASAAGYAVNWGGIGVWLEPGSDFSQYGKEWSLNGRCACALFASAGSTSPKYTGTSRVKILSGYLNGEGIADSMCAYLGPFSDTFVFDCAMNSYAFGIVVANGHAHDLMHADYENAGGPPPVTGLAVEYNSCRGILIMADNANDAHGNRAGGYFRQCGTAIELCGPVNETQIGASSFRSNKANLVIGPLATNTHNPFGY